MKTSMPRYSMFKYISKSFLKLDSTRYSFVSKFIKNFNKHLNEYVEKGYYPNPYYTFYSSTTDISSISDYVLQPKLFPRQFPNVRIFSIKDFVNFIQNYSDIRLRHYGDLTIYIDFGSLYLDILSNQF